MLAIRPTRFLYDCRSVELFRLPVYASHAIYTSVDSIEYEEARGIILRVRHMPTAVSCCRSTALNSDCGSPGYSNEVRHRRQNAVQCIYTY